MPAKICRTQHPMDFSQVSSRAWQFKLNLGTKETTYHITFYNILHSFEICRTQIFSKTCHIWIYIKSMISDDFAETEFPGRVLFFGNMIKCHYVLYVAPTYSVGDSDGKNYHRIRSAEETVKRSYQLEFKELLKHSPENHALAKNSSSAEPVFMCHENFNGSFL